MGKGAPGILILIRCMRHHVPTHLSVRGFRGLRLGNRRMFGFFAVARYRERARRAYADSCAAAYAYANRQAVSDRRADTYPVSHRNPDRCANPYANAVSNRNHNPDANRAEYAALRI